MKKKIKIRLHDNMKSQNCSGIFIRINKIATMVNFFHSSNYNSFQVSCYVFNLNLVDDTKVILTFKFYIIAWL